MTYNENIKKATYKYREKHLDEYRMITNKAQKIYYSKNIEKVKEYKKQLYLFQKEWKRLVNLGDLFII